MQKGKKKPAFKKALKREKLPLNRAFTKILPKVYERMNYTPQELWLKFTQYIERSDKNSEEITISWFAVFSQTSSKFLTEHKDSQEFSEVVDNIMSTFENRYEQAAAKWLPVSYIMNNRFKGKRESVQKNENTEMVNKDVKDILDQIIYNKNNPDGSK